MNEMDKLYRLELKFRKLVYMLANSDIEAEKIIELHNIIVDLEVDIHSKKNK